MMVKIFIEGKNKNVPESEFVQAILNNISIPSDKYELVHVDGYKNLMDSVNTSNIGIMRSNTDAGGKNIVLFDADTTKNNGGFQNRREELLARKEELHLEFDLFLWPNNNDDGDVEVLMESIAKRDLYSGFFDCFERYEHCLSRWKDKNDKPIYSTPNRKAKLYAYFHTIPISKTKKNLFGHGIWKWEDKEIWNMESESLIPIKEFLLERLS